VKLSIFNSHKVRMVTNIGPELYCQIRDYFVHIDIYYVRFFKLYRHLKRERPKKVN